MVIIDIEGHSYPVSVGVRYDIIGHDSVDMLEVVDIIPEVRITIQFYYKGEKYLGRIAPFSYPFQNNFHRFNFRIRADVPNLTIEDVL